eukprot:TRINITY_DN1794_c0_g2_i1.p1 TRINITY_DN1794_c0_g2~~TRINITY_DN1794_c0_g2_i1.p1  ORF type:complete len:640 (-),score=42.66 TRINITY_DN1794_c0_g2_i1:90-2009(-)
MACSCSHWTCMIVLLGFLARTACADPDLTQTSCGYQELEIREGETSSCAPCWWSGFDCGYVDINTTDYRARGDCGTCDVGSVCTAHSCILEFCPTGQIMRTDVVYGTKVCIDCSDRGYECGMVYEDAGWWSRWTWEGDCGNCSDWNGAYVCEGYWCYIDCATVPECSPISDEWECGDASVGRDCRDRPCELKCPEGLGCNHQMGRCFDCASRCDALDGPGHCGPGYDACHEDCYVRCPDGYYCDRYYTCQDNTPITCGYREVLVDLTEGKLCAPCDDYLRTPIECGIVDWTSFPGLGFSMTGDCGSCQPGFTCDQFRCVAATDPVSTGVASSSPTGVGCLPAPLPVANVTMSSFWWTHPPSNLVDGDLRTFIHSEEGEVDRWVQVKLSTPAVVTRVQLYNRAELAGRVGKFVVFFGTADLGSMSADALSVSPLVVGRYMGPDYAQVSYDFAGPAAPVLFIKFWTNTTFIPNTVFALHLAEMIVWGCPDSVAAGGTTGAALSITTEAAPADSDLCLHTLRGYWQEVELPETYRDHAELVFATVQYSITRNDCENKHLTATYQAPSCIQALIVVDGCTGSVQPQGSGRFLVGMEATPGCNMTVAFSRASSSPTALSVQRVVEVRNEHGESGVFSVLVPLCT